MRIGLAAMAVALLAAPAALGAELYSGEWEYQALNAGDTNFKVEHKGDEITFYRVLWPEFEGERFKLEHIYRGRFAGQSISGDMFVREEGMAEFERLRIFDGRILGQGRITMDGLPLKRVERAPEPVAAAPEKPRYKKVIIEKGARKEQQQGEQKSDQGSATRLAIAALAAPETIPIMASADNRVLSMLQQRAEGLLKDGDMQFQTGRFAAAMEKYEAAYDLDHGRVELLQRLGLSHGLLGSKATREGKSKQAAEHYRKAIGFWKRAVRLDPYNRDIRRNIRRIENALAL